MGILYKEVVRHRKASFVQGLFLILLSIFTANLFVNGWDYSSRYNIELELLMFVNCIFLTVVLKIIYNIVYRQKVCYTYKLIDRELIFEKTVWGSRRAILSINTRDIETLAPLDKENSAERVNRVFRFLCGSSKCKTYCCIVNNSGKREMLYFQPSSELVKKLNTIIKGAAI